MSEPHEVVRRNVRSAIQARNYAEAERGLHLLRRDDPLAFETRMLELELLSSTGRIDEARRCADRLLDRFPESARAHYLAGRSAYLAREYGRAEPMLRESISLEPRWWNQRYLGKTLTQVGRFDEAEAILIELVEQHPLCKKDLAWLYERRGRFASACNQVESFLRDRPNDRMAQDQLRRLKAKSLDPDALIEEAETLIQLGETLSDDLWPAYVRSLLERGRREDAATIIAENLSCFSTKLACTIGWECRALQALDLTCELFLRGFGHGVRNVKFLNALESAARLCDRSSDLIPVYEAHADEHRNLYGRLHGVRASASKEAGST